ncbi:MAG TPA: helix-turn-helix transcriptional regulator [Actinocrinis sp.]|uniref:helix-turn-helix domain-containing protein n=1 Tax=Actinocrinis sp. TaxID=1920516 RepID=UPI002DDD0183|nr:helix-turn-helix transcriptional regulator [Actinocrinis sp.]HEV2346431.1 helix-turn-helix transcriptional regulator [Actinocrinis sp.]
MDSPTRTPPSPTLMEFGKAVDVHFTTASRYRNGERVPSTGVAHRIIQYYNLDPGELLAAIAAGREAFGHYMRMHVFGPEPAVDLNPDGSEKLAA